MNPAAVGLLFPKAVAQFIRTVVELEFHVDEAKVSLLENHLFNPFVAFQYLDRFGQGYATRGDIRAFFKKYSIEIQEQELEYLLYQRGKIGTLDHLASRPDAFYYENFLNMIKPGDEQKLAKNLASRDGSHSGTALLLPAYVFNQFIEYFQRELKVFDALQSLRVELINLYGYTASPAFKLISADDDRITYFEMKLFLEKHGFTISQQEFQLICAVYQEEGKRDNLSKTNFLGLFTPFDKNIYHKVGDRRYDELTGDQNRKQLQDYLSNAYRYQPPPPQGEAGDPRLQRVAKIMQNLYSNHEEVDKFAKKNLSVTPDGRVFYKLEEKKFPYYSINGFKDYFDGYHRQLYSEVRGETHDLLLGKTMDELEKFSGKEKPQTVTYATREKASVPGVPYIEPAGKLEMLKAYMSTPNT